MEPQGYEEIEHTADWALRVRGNNLEELFRNAALGMLQLAGVEPREGLAQKRLIELQATDSEGLLVTWLEEILFILESEDVTFTEFDLRLEGNTRLTATVQEAPLMNIKEHIKAVTYHNLRIARMENGFEVTVVFDV
ncbi:MAG TPA: archease [Anaerolineae bacterium]|nr:archease [Anaerolineae bacterium]